MKLRSLILSAFLASTLCALLFIWWGLQQMLVSQEVAYLIIWMTLGANLLGALVGSLLLHPSARRLQLLSREMTRVADQDFRPVQTVTSPQELASLTASINQMIQDLNQSFQALSQSEADKTQLMANLSHDIKTPLTALQHQIEALQDQLVAPEEVSAVYQTMACQVERLTTLTQQLMEVGLLDRPTHPVPLAPHLERLQLDDFLIHLLTSIQPHCNAKGQTLAVEVAPGLDALTTDRTKLERILLNLLDNASKYAEPQTRIELQVDAWDGGTRFQVRDQGPGIPPQALPHLFERLYRVEPSRNRATGGAGLGLYISQSLTQQLGGQLSVTSQVGQGSTFTLWLPDRSSQ